MKELKFITNAKNAIKICAANGKALWSRNGSKYMMWCGVGLMIGGSVYLAKQTLKLEPVLDKANADIERAKTTGDKKEITKAYGRAALSVGSVFGGPVIVEVAGVTLILKAFGIAESRFLVMEGIAASVQKEFDTYRNRTKEYVGEEIENRIHYGLKQDVVEIEEKLDNGETKIIKEQVDKPVEILVTHHGYWFDEEHIKQSHYYNDDMYSNIRTVKMVKNYILNVLKTRGYIWKNEILTSSGYKHDQLSPDGWVNGYIMPNMNRLNDRDNGKVLILEDGRPNIEMTIPTFGGEELDNINIQHVFSRYGETADFYIDLPGCSYIADRVQDYISGKIDY